MNLIANGQIIVGPECDYEVPRYGSDEEEPTKCEESANYFVDYVIGGPGQQSILISSLPNPLPGEFILLTTNLIIDENRHIEGKTIKVSVGKSITVNEDITLSLKFNTLFACDGMWEGIVLTGQESSLIMDRNWVEDAINVVDISNPLWTQYALDIDRNVFNRNLNGIKAIRPNAAFTPSESKVTRNEFKCTSPLFHTQYEYSFAGIHYEGPMLWIDPPHIGMANEFSNHDFGIYFPVGTTQEFDEVLNLGFQKFDNIFIDAIHTNADVVTLREHFCFNIGRSAIRSTNPKILTVKDCYFENSSLEGLPISGANPQFRHGVHVSGTLALSPTISIQNNEFKHTTDLGNVNYQAIHISATSVASNPQCTISGNNIEITANYSTGLFVTGHYSSGSFFDVFDNRFSVLLGTSLSFVTETINTYGIRLVGGNKRYFKIGANDFVQGHYPEDLLSTRAALLINSPDASGTDFYDNRLNMKRENVQVRNFNNAKFCGNFNDMVLTGSSGFFFNTASTLFQFSNFNEAEIIGNISTGNNMLRLFPTVYVGTQEYKGNTWLSNAINFNNPHRALCNDLPTAFPNQFIMHVPKSTQNDPTEFYPEEVVIGTIGYDVDEDWFRYEDPGSQPLEFACVARSSFKPSQLDFISDDSYFDRQSYESWMMRYNIVRDYRNGLTYPSGYATALAQFVSDHVGQDTMYQILGRMDAFQQSNANLDSLGQLYQVYLDSLEVYEGVEDVDSISQAVSFMETHLELIADEAGLFNNDLAIHTNAIVADLDDVIGNLDTATVSIARAIKFLLSDTINLADIDTILTPFNEIWLEGLQVDCLPEYSQPSGQMSFENLHQHLMEEYQKTSQTSLLLFPNPVTDIINFSTVVSAVKVYDTAGQVVLSGQGDELISHFNVGPLLPGSYMVVFTDESNEVHHQIIIKQ